MGVDINKCKVTVIYDSREQENSHILKALNKAKIKHCRMNEKASLKVGDYSLAAKLPNGNVINFKDKIVIERKANVGELCSNFCEKRDASGKNRLIREFERAKEQGIKLILLVEDEEGYKKALKGEFRTDKDSEMNPKAFIGMLMAYKARYGFELMFESKEMSASLMYKLLYYEAREILKNMEVK